MHVGCTRQTGLHGLQVGSLGPGIEVWDLDVLDAVEPVATLGGEVGAAAAAAAGAAGAPAEAANGGDAAGRKKAKQKQKRKEVRGKLLEARVSRARCRSVHGGLSMDQVLPTGALLLQCSSPPGREGCEHPCVAHVTEWDVSSASAEEEEEAAEGGQPHRCGAGPGLELRVPQRARQRQC